MLSIKVPFVDLKAQYQSIKVEIDNAIESVISETAFIKGKYVTDFENSFARKNDVKNCIGLANGTDAIYVVLRALGVGPGDEVITTSLSWISTSETISQTGATPLFIDIDPRYYSIDVSRIEEKISSKTKAILPVHLYGQPVEISHIQEICNSHNLFLIEDCAQAHFAEYKGKKVGTFGIAGTFSFYPAKNLGAYGDAGAVITNDNQLSEKVRRIADHGTLIKHDHEIEGINSRLDGIQASILSVKLKYIDEWNQKRYKNALYYNELLKDVDNISTPDIYLDVSHVFHLYVIRAIQRSRLQQYLEEKGIQSGIHYPTALPFLPPYADLNYTADELPVAFAYQDEILSLPMYPELTQDQIQYVCDSIKSFYL